jgi:hypothetical protein
MDIVLDTNVLFVFAGVMTPISVVAIRHWILKIRCYTILQQDMITQKEATIQGQADHKDIFGRLNNLDKNVHLILGAMKIKPVD